MLSIRRLTTKRASATKTMSLIYSYRIIDSDTGKKINSVAVATARLSDAVSEQ